jgi:hypothetical protein
MTNPVAGVTIRGGNMPDYERHGRDRAALAKRMSPKEAAREGSRASGSGAFDVS